MDELNPTMAVLLWYCLLCLARGSNVLFQECVDEILKLCH